MPSLDFKGKQFVYAHHLSVPFRQLDIAPDKSLPDKTQGNGKPSLDDNLIIHGDNLHALKALLPKYASKVKCIYIDPPYNTGEEGWCYNDKVNAPLIKEWLKDSANPVDKEDLERRDKWLCMMWPRLQLLRELLVDDGIMFISIDGNEHHNLLCMMNEIYGEDNYITSLIWKKKKGGGNDANYVATEHEYITIYARNREYLENIFVPYTEDYLKRYKEEDSEGKFYWDTFLRKSGKQYYPIECPDGTILEFDENGNKLSWLRSKARLTEDLKKGDVRIIKVNNEWTVHFKQRLPHGKKPRSIMDNTVLEQHGTTSSGNKEFFQFFKNYDFDNPKPSSLIKYLIGFIVGDNDIILDSFAGSGTTAHAVLALNKEDGGNRKFILVECEDYADSMTAERVRRIINGVPGAKDETLKTGLGGSFTFCELGQEINIENLLKGDKLPAYDELARYASYTATGLTLDEVKQGADYLIGETENYRLHLIYKPDRASLPWACP